MLLHVKRMRIVIKLRDFRILFGMTRLCRKIGTSGKVPFALFSREVKNSAVGTMRGCPFYSHDRCSGVSRR